MIQTSKHIEKLIQPKNLKEVSESQVIKSLRLIDEFTLEITFCDNCNVNIEEIDEAYRLLDNFSGKKPMKRLIILGSHTIINDEARLKLVSENRKRKRTIIAEAIIANGCAQKFFSLFYIIRLKNIYPSSFFSNVDDARSWLSEYSS